MQDLNWQAKENTANNEMIASEQKIALQMVSILSAKLSKDGSQWCWLYGENLQEGIAGFGDTPMQAAFDFERNFS